LAKSLIFITAARSQDRFKGQEVIMEAHHLYRHIKPTLFSHLRPAMRVEPRGISRATALIIFVQVFEIAPQHAEARPRPEHDMLFRGRWDLQRNGMAAEAGKSVIPARRASDAQYRQEVVAPVRFQRPKWAAAGIPR
jgi:hypothetical protein